MLLTKCPDLVHRVWHYYLTVLLPPPKRLWFHRFSWFAYVFVCFFVGSITQKLLNQFSQKLGGKVAHGPWKKSLEFGDNLDHSVWVSVGNKTNIFRPRPRPDVQDQDQDQDQMYKTKTETARPRPRPQLQNQDQDQDRCIRTSIRIKLLSK